MRTKYGSAKSNNVKSSDAKSVKKVTKSKSNTNVSDSDIEHSATDASDTDDITSVECIHESIIPSSEILINGKDDQHIKIMGCEPESAEKFSKLINYFAEKNHC